MIVSSQIDTDGNTVFQGISDDWLISKNQKDYKNCNVNFALLRIELNFSTV